MAIKANTTGVLYNRDTALAANLRGLFFRMTFSSDPRRAALVVRPVNSRSSANLEVGHSALYGTSCGSLTRVTWCDPALSMRFPFFSVWVHGMRAREEAILGKPGQ